MEKGNRRNRKRKKKAIEKRITKEKRTRNRKRPASTSSPETGKDECMNRAGPAQCSLTSLICERSTT